MKSVLLTSFGGSASFEILNDFKRRGCFRLFIADMNADAPARLITDDFIVSLPGAHKNYATDLLQKALKNKIDFIIPGSDEEAFALMKAQAEFKKHGILVAVQNVDWCDVLSSKTAVYDFLSKKGCRLPKYQKFATPSEFQKAVEFFGSKQNCLLVKPNQARGGRGIVVLSSNHVSNNTEHFLVQTHEDFSDALDGQTEYLMMAYLEGTVYDVDVLNYKNNDLYLGVRRRFHNPSKPFTGNIFDLSESVIAYAKQIYKCLPSTYLLDYDLMVEKSGFVHLLEVNPRPSGSLVSYIPFGINLYDILARSYVLGEHKKIDQNLSGKLTKPFYQMIPGIWSQEVYK